MNHLHFEFEAGPTHTVEVTLEQQANVRLLDEQNYEKYIDGKDYQYYGGHATVTPFKLRPPCEGRWHIAVDLGDRRGTVTAGIRVRS